MTKSRTMQKERHVESMREMSNAEKTLVESKRPIKLHRYQSNIIKSDLKSDVIVCRFFRWFRIGSSGKLL
jgi:hypothetical protein